MMNTTYSLVSILNAYLLLFSFTLPQVNVTVTRHMRVILKRDLGINKRLPILSTGV